MSTLLWCRWPRAAVKHGEATLCRSVQGFSLVEMLVTLAVVGVVLAGINSFFVSSSQSLVRQNGLVEMQANAQAAMDFMVQELRQASGTPTISTSVVANDTISFSGLEDTGYSSGANSASTLQDTRKSWKVGAQGFNSVSVQGGVTL